MTVSFSRALLRGVSQSLTSAEVLSNVILFTDAISTVHYVDQPNEAKAFRQTTRNFNCYQHANRKSDLVYRAFLKWTRNDEIASVRIFYVRNYWVDSDNISCWRSTLKITKRMYVWSFRSSVAVTLH